MNARFLTHLLTVLLVCGSSLLALPVRAADEAPDALIKRLSTDVLDNIKADKSIQAGDYSRIVALVDSKIMPNVDFQRMTSAAVGPAWRKASPEQLQSANSLFGGRAKRFQIVDYGGLKE